MTTPLILPAAPQALAAMGEEMARRRGVC